MTATPDLAVTDNTPNTVSVLLNTTSTWPPAITSANATTFTAATAGTFTVTASGVPAPAITLTGGSLPGGVTFTSATGVLAGTPTTSGSYGLTFTAHSTTAPDATQSFTLTVSAGTLSIAVPASVALSGGTTSPGGTVSGAVGTVTVTDNRGTSAGWVTSVYSTTGFTATASTAIAVAGVTYTPGSTTTTTVPNGSATITAGTSGAPGATSGAARTAYTYGNATAGTNSVSWNPTLAVVIPITAKAGAAYSGTITHQVV